ncbi:MAG: hypothetical protein GF364_04960 [Candidatus Lokiarchaeota archaeon]|nr:hypothetical protein [Candidatus Lokiarchaeota archaeon]
MKSFIHFNDRSGSEISVHPGEMGLWTISLIFEEEDPILSKGQSIKIQKEQHKFDFGRNYQTKIPEKEDYVWIEIDGDFHIDVNFDGPNFELKIQKGQIRPGNAINLHIGKSEKREYLPVVHEALLPLIHYYILLRNEANDTDEIMSSFIIKFESGTPAKLSIKVPSIISVGTDFNAKLHWEDKFHAPKSKFVGNIQYVIEPIEDVSKINIEFEWSPIEPNNTKGVGDHNLYFQDAKGPLLFRHSLQDLIEDLREYKRAFAIPHVGGWIPNLYYDNYRRDLIPLIEIASVHGRSEYFLQEMLMRGYKSCVCAMSDGHEANPGHTIFAHSGHFRVKPRAYSRRNGFTACMCRDLTRSSVYESLVNGNTYATTGSLDILYFKINDALQGKITQISNPTEIFVCIMCNIPIDRIEIICDEYIIESHIVRPEYNQKVIYISWNFPLHRLPKSINLDELAVYCRITHRNGDIAWSSPIWITDSDKSVRQYNNDYPKFYESIWPPKSLMYDITDERLSEVESRFGKMIKRWNLDKRITDLTYYGIFKDYLGLYYQVRGFDTLGQFPCRLNYYFSFDHDVLYADHGYNDTGTFYIKYKKQKWLARTQYLELRLTSKDDKDSRKIPFLRKTRPALEEKYRDIFKPELYVKNGDTITFWDEMQFVPELEDIYEEIKDMEEATDTIYFGVENYLGDWALFKWDSLLKQWTVEYNQSIKVVNLKDVQDIIENLVKL